MSRTASITRKQERNLKKLERKFGSFDYTNPCDRCGPVNSRFDAFIAGLLDQDKNKLTRDEKNQIQAAVDSASDDAGNIDWGIVSLLIQGIQGLRANRWLSIYSRACMPGGLRKMDPNDPTGHPAWAERELCQQHKAQEAQEQEQSATRPRFNVFEAVASGMPVRPFVSGTDTPAVVPEKDEEPTPIWMWAVPAALLIFLVR